MHYFCSGGWQEKFTEVAQQLREHERTIRLDLQLYIAGGIQVANHTLVDIQASVSQVPGISNDIVQLRETTATLMSAIFDIKSTHEQVLEQLVAQQHGGRSAVMNNERLLNHVLTELKAGAGNLELNDKGQSAKKPATSLGLGITLAKINKSVEKVLIDEKDNFDKKFEDMEAQITKLIKHQTDRTIQEIRAATGVDVAERIIDKVCRCLVNLFKHTLTENGIGYVSCMEEYGTPSVGVVLV